MLQPMAHKCYWHEFAQRLSYPSLQPGLHYDVAIVGGGITGLSTGLRLKEAGKRVAVLEANQIGGGTTGCSTGHLDVTNDMDLHVVRSKHGKEALRAMLHSNAEMIDRVEQWVEQYHINCGFTRIPGYLYAENDDGVEALMKEYKAAREAEFAVEWEEERILPFEVKRLIRFPDQARFAPLEYVVGLARAFDGDGCAVYEHTHVEAYDEDEPCRVHTNHGELTCDVIVLAVHAPFVGLVSLQTRSFAYQTYVIAARVMNEVKDALYWDMDDPYHYTRVASTSEPQLLIIGGQDHRTGDKVDGEERYSRLEQYAMQRYNVHDVEYRWSHEYFEPVDAMPFIGLVPGESKVYIATGFSGDGLKFGSVAALLISDLILGHENALEEIYRPSRFKPMASAKLMAAGIGHAAAHALGDRLSSGDAKSLEEIPMNEGRIILLHGERLAVYRDTHGDFHAMSPVCRHAGGIVQWNNTEKTWDCPLHGGRYDAYGKVMVPPPKSDLKPHALPVKESETGAS